MAHRKQIKITKKSTAKERTESSNIGMRQTMRQKRKKKKTKSELAIQEPSTDETEPKKEKRKTKPAFLDSSSEAETDEIEPKRRKGKLNQYFLVSSTEVETEPSSEPQPSPSSESQPGQTSEPQPGQSSEPQPGPSSALGDKQAPDNDDLCHKCFSDKEGDWIQCDSCDHWFHRKCAGMKTFRGYKKVSATGSSWFCKDCK